MDNYIYIRDNSDYLCKKVPQIIDFSVNAQDAYLIEEFLEHESLKQYLTKCESIDKGYIYNQFISILEEFQRIRFMHLDINLNNIYVSDSNEVYFIDLGFSLIKNYSINFFKNNKLRNLVFNNLNRDTRLDVGIIDDAVSFNKVCESIDNNFITNNNKQWHKINELSNRLYFNYKELLKNEN